MTRIQRAVAALIKEHHGLRAAARATGIDPGYLCRLKQGRHENPGKEVMDLLGLERRVSYRQVNGG